MEICLKFQNILSFSFLNVIFMIRIMTFLTSLSRTIDFYQQFSLNNRFFFFIHVFSCPFPSSLFQLSLSFSVISQKFKLSPPFQQIGHMVWLPHFSVDCSSAWSKVCQGYNKDLILLTSYVVLDYDFEQAVLFFLNLHLCLFI